MLASLQDSCPIDHHAVPITRQEVDINFGPCRPPELQIPNPLHKHMISSFILNFAQPFWRNEHHTGSMIVLSISSSATNMAPGEWHFGAECVRRCAFACGAAYGLLANLRDSVSFRASSGIH